MSINNNAPTAEKAGMGAKESGEAPAQYSTADYLLHNKPYQRHIAELKELPLELTERPIWCAWKLVQKPNKAKPDKVPVSPKDGRQNGWTLPKFCTTAEQAIHYAEAHKTLQGVGIILHEDSGLAGGDLDDCIHPDTGELSEEATRIVVRADTYAEVSPGLEGVRFIAEGSFGGYVGNNQQKGVEFYQDARMLTITGFHIEETPFAIEKRNLTELGKDYHQKGQKTRDSQERPDPSESSDFNDLELDPRIREWIVQGADAGQDRSNIMFGVAKDLLRAGAEPGRVLSILSDPGHGISMAAYERRGDNPEAAQDWIWKYCILKAIKEVENEPTFDFEQGEGQEWPDLVSLDVNPPKGLPVDQWPSPLSDFAQALARETETPIELPGMLALGTIAAASQRLASVEIKRGYSEPINIYTAVALPPATRKSGVFKRATAPLVKWESDQRRNIEQEVKAAESRLSTHKERVKQLKQKAAKAKTEEEAKDLAEQVAELETNEPQVPAPPRVFTSDVTTEHAATMMGQNGDSLAIMSPEGGIFETMAGKYNQGVPNFDLYLQAHAADPVRVDRGSKPPVMMDSPRLSMVLAVQPDVLNSMSNKPGFKGRGLLGRFLYAVPPSNLGKREGISQPVDPFTDTNWNERIRELLDASHDAEQPATLSLTNDAFQVWRECWKSVEAELGEHGLFEHCQDWAGKMPGAAARIAALFHLARHGGEGLRYSIEAEDMRVAVNTADALATHALAVYGQMGADETIEGAKVLLRWIKRHHHREFTARDAYQGHKSRFQRADDLRAPLEVLKERGYIRPVSTKSKAGRPSNAYEVNPAALDE